MSVSPTSDEPAAHTGIVVRGATKSFDGKLALPPTDLTAPAGAVTLLTGHNGAGKTTLLRILATLVHPDQGHLRINGLDPVRDGGLVREQLGVALVNERALYWRLNVRENVEFVARVRGVPKRERAERSQAALESVGLADLGSQNVAVLSAGQKQRTVLARALVGHPPVLLVDEPLRGLDEDSEAQVLATLAAHAALGATVLVASPTIRDFSPLHAATATIGDAA